MHQHYLFTKLTLIFDFYILFPIKKYDISNQTNSLVLMENSKRFHKGYTKGLSLKAFFANVGLF